MFTVAETQIYGIRSRPTFLIRSSSASRSTLPLKGCSLAGIVPFGNDHVDERAAGQFLVQPGGGEVHVAGHEVARLDEHLREDVLGAASLVGGHEVAIAVILAHGVFEVIEVAAAGVGLVAEHHAGPLPVAHGAGAAVGQQVDVNVLGAEQEGVVAGLAHGPFALAAREHLDRLDDFDFPRFRPGAAGWVAMLAWVYLVKESSARRGSAATAPARLPEVKTYSMPLRRTGFQGGRVAQGQGIARQGPLICVVAVVAWLLSLTPVARLSAGMRNGNNHDNVHFQTTKHQHVRETRNPNVSISSRQHGQ